MATVAALSRKSSAAAATTGGEVVRHDDARVTADQAAGTASIRTLGTGSAQAAAGDHNHNAAYSALGHSHSAVLVPFAPVALTDAATIAVDASQGTHFRVTLGGNRTLGAPSNPTDGQKILVEVKQDATGSRTLAYNAVYRFGADVPQPTLTTTASKKDFLGFVYHSSDAKWDCIAVAKGY